MTTTTAAGGGGCKFFFFCQKKLKLAPFWTQAETKYWWYYPHRSRDLVSPVFGNFLKILYPDLVFFLYIIDIWFILNTKMYLLIKLLICYRKQTDVKRKSLWNIFYYINIFNCIVWHSSSSKLVQIPECPRHSWHTKSNQTHTLPSTGFNPQGLAPKNFFQILSYVSKTSWFWKFEK